MNNTQNCDMEKFYRVFGADAEAHTADAYNVYIKGAEKVWKLYSSKYEMRPRSNANARKGTNRGVELYDNDVHLIGISIGLNSTTLYVHDAALRAKIRLSYEQYTAGKYRCKMENIDEVLNIINDVL